MRAWPHIAGAILFLLLLAATPVAAQAPPPAVPVPDVQVQSLPAINAPANFDPVRATESYLWRVSGTDRIRSDAYFEGRYWLSAIRVVYALMVAAAILWLGISAAMRDSAARLTNKPFWQAAIYIVQYIVVMTVLTFPLTVYQSYARERVFELSNQTFWQWLGDFGLSTVVNLVLGTILLTILYWVVRKARQFWWIWGAAVSVVFLVFALAITPNVLAPLFFNYTTLPDSPLKTEIQAMSRAHGFDADKIFVINTSERNKRLSANVLGFGKTAHIVVSDNLINQGTPREVKTAIALAIGHSVMNHALTGVLMFSVIIFAGFAFAHYGFLLLVSIFGDGWQVRGQSDPAGLPVFIALGTLFFLFTSPVSNWISRHQDKQADAFALDTARQPDALATLVLKQSAYVKLEPGEIEEILFYNQPTGRSRIGNAMRWKAAHLSDRDIADGPISPQ